MGSFFENILKGNIAGKILSGSKNGIDLGDILGGLGKGKTTKEKEPDVPVETGNSEMSLENVTSDSLDDALEKIGKDRVRISFDEPVRFAAPGQSAVFYDQDDCLLGGGVISEVIYV